MKINWEQISMKIITMAGMAKSSAMEALYKAKEKKYDESSALIDQSNKEITEASHQHFEIIQQEAQGKQLEFKVLFLHAEDQLLTTQTLIILVVEMIEMYKRFDKN